MDPADGLSDYLKWYEYVCQDWHTQLHQLKELQQESWVHTDNLLRMYIIHTFEACYQQQKTHILDDSQGTALQAFNTALMTPAWEDIYNLHNVAVSGKVVVRSPSGLEVHSSHQRKRHTGERACGGAYDTAPPSHQKQPAM